MQFTLLIKIMNNFNCIICDLNFAQLANLKSHYLSVKHINKSLKNYKQLKEKNNELLNININLEKENNKIKNEFDEIKKNNDIINKINIQLTQENLLLKTKNINNEKIIEEKNNKIKVHNITVSKLNTKINELSKKLDEEYNKKDNIIKDQINILNKFAEKEEIKDVGMSALTYANKYYTNAPALLRISNYQINDYDLTNPEEKEKLLNTIINYHDNKTLHRLLGDHIIKYYKKTNPEDQSFHSTDCSRLTYIVRDIVENAGKWIQDRNGIIVSDKIIKPIVEKCVEMLIELQTQLTKELAANLNKIDKRIYNILEIISSIDKGEMVNEINKYIAPYFSLQKLIK